MQRSGLYDKECSNIWKEINAHTKGKPVGIKVSEVGPYGRWKQYRYKLPHDCKERIDVCKSVFELSIFPNGDVFPCCSGAISEFLDQKEKPGLLWLGNLDKTSLSEIIEAAETSLVLNALRIAGPNGLLDIWGNNGAIHREPLLFCGTCDLCIAVNKELGIQSPILVKNAHHDGKEDIRLRLQQSWDERVRLLPDP
jgi:hypothetical protein